jgi:hypothetical protein
MEQLKISQFVACRNTCATRCFNNELQACTRVTWQQGETIPKFLGLYWINFPDHQLEEDREVSNNNGGNGRRKDFIKNRGPSTERSLMPLPGNN